MPPQLHSQFVQPSPHRQQLLLQHHHLREKFESVGDDLSKKIIQNFPPKNQNHDSHLGARRVSEHHLVAHGHGAALHPERGA
jgi:hypothetical protein